MRKSDSEPVITSLDDGTVRIDVGDQSGWVSSHHLVDQKLKQLINAQRNKQERT